MISKETFIENYCANSNKTWEEISQFNVVLPCACGYEGCKGWAMVSNNPMFIESHMDLYAPKVGADKTVELR